MFWKEKNLHYLHVRSTSEKELCGFHDRRKYSHAIEIELWRNSWTSIKNRSILLNVVLDKPPTKNFSSTNENEVYFINGPWSIDLIDLHGYSLKNESYTYSFCSNRCFLKSQFDHSIWKKLSQRKIPLKTFSSPQEGNQI